MRSIIAGFVGISQILRAIDIVNKADVTFNGNVMNGREPLFDAGVKERVVRLAGKESDVTALSLARYHQHIVPIYEQPDAVASLVEKHSKGGQLPCIWHVPSGGYSQTEADNKWNGFVPTTDCTLCCTHLHVFSVTFLQYPSAPSSPSSQPSPPPSPPSPSSPLPPSYPSPPTSPPPQSCKY